MSSTPVTSSAQACVTTTSANRSTVSARYVVCIALLLLTLVGMKIAQSALSAYFTKDAVPLKKSLASADPLKLAPEYHPYGQPPSPLSEDEVDSLGTHEYLQWALSDSIKSDDARDRIAHIFITYYTGKPDMVPHVPDECYQAGGLEPKGPSRTHTIKVAGVGAKGDEVPIRVAEFLGRRSLVGLTPDRTVMYFFHTNGDYCSTRDEVRLKLANPFARRAYYAKIEVDFTDVRGGPSPDVNGSLAALQRLLPKLMPMFLNDHLAWNESNAAAGNGVR